MSEDLQQQQEEIVVVESIFPEEYKFINDFHEITIPISKKTIKLKWKYPTNYPSSTPPIFMIESSWLKDSQISSLAEHLNSIFQQGEVVIYKWADWLRENTVEFLQIPDEPEPEPEPEIIETPVTTPPEEPPKITEPPEKISLPSRNIQITSGEPVTDRKSKFVGHFAVVTSMDDVQWVIDELKRDKKIANATHNIAAWRIAITNTKGAAVLEENRDDDGETGAGDKLLYMLQRLNAVNVAVVVTRWYGGIQLGADRFKHITNVAQALVKPYVEGLETKTEKKGKKN